MLNISRLVITLFIAFLFTGCFSKTTIPSMHSSPTIPSIYGFSNETPYNVYAAKSEESSRIGLFKLVFEPIYGEHLLTEGSYNCIRKRLVHFQGTEEEDDDLIYEGDNPLLYYICSEGRTL